MTVYFIAIGGSVMHNLAIALKLKGYDVNGSDDEIFEPAKGNLLKYNLLPAQMGWNPARITNDIDAIVLGMHAKPDNPELKKAQELGLKIYSFPEFLFEQAKNKKRVVIGGSHGKTSITAMIMHILEKNKMAFDYMVGSAVKGFDITVRLTDDAPIMIFEGDEYPDSAINRTPKFHLYQPDIALISGIAWDHINVFPTIDTYIEQFRKFVDLIPYDGALVFNLEDETVSHIATSGNPSLKKISYATPVFVIEEGITYIIEKQKKIPLQIFGRHNLQNMMGAVEVCKLIGIEETNCFEAMKDFDGAARRMESVSSTAFAHVFRDFAHAPSKLKATIAAVKEQFTSQKLIACFELHTFSSLNRDFLGEYFQSMHDADIKVVFFNQHTFELKRMEPLEAEFIKEAFGDRHIHVFNEAKTLTSFLEEHTSKINNLLMMSSGNFDGMDLTALSNFGHDKN